MFWKTKNLFYPYFCFFSSKPVGRAHIASPCSPVQQYSISMSKAELGTSENKCLWVLRMIFFVPLLETFIQSLILQSLPIPLILHNTSALSGSMNEGCVIFWLLCLGEHRRGLYSSDTCPFLYINITDVFPPIRISVQKPAPLFFPKSHTGGSLGKKTQKKTCFC